MKFTYYTIIGKDLNLLKGHVQNIKEYAGFDKLECEKEFNWNKINGKYLQLFEECFSRHQKSI